MSTVKTLGRAALVAAVAGLAFYKLAAVFPSDQPAPPPVSDSYALYSSRWKDQQSLPHGARVVLPADPASFTRSLQLLQSAQLVKLSQASGGTVTEADIVESPRHLRLLRLSSDEHLPEIYQQYDALVLNARQARSLGLDPATDPLAGPPGGKEVTP